jgi:ribosomal protein S6--L-glutamate ligase
MACRLAAMQPHSYFTWGILGLGCWPMDHPINNFVLGWREWVAMPQLGLPAIKAKIDTGARTSALHAFSIETFGPEHQPKVRFGVHPVEGRDDIEVFCTAKVMDRRQVISSNGQSEIRY